MAERPCHVVIVEDDIDSRELFVLALEAAGFTAHAAEDVAHARQIVAEVQPDALVADYRLPDGTGNDVLALCGDTRPALCILLTGFDAVDIDAKGFDLVLTKPVGTEKLIETIRKHVDACA
jgi:two-component system response regulator HydG